MGSSASATNVSAGNVTVTTTPSAGTDNFTMVLANYGPKTGYGTNGFYINDATGDDQSGKGNDWTPVNTPTDTSDTPTTIYPIISPIDRDNAGTWNVQSGGLKVAPGSTTMVARATMGFDVDVMTCVYWETAIASWSFSSTFIGLINQGATLTGGNSVSAYANGYGIYPGNGNKYNNGTNSAYGSAFNNVTIANLVKDGKIYWGTISGGTITWYNSGDPDAGTGFAFSGLTGMYFPCSSTAADGTITFNFGATDFAATTLPTGAVALNSANIYAADPPAIEDGSAHFQTSLYTGTGSSLEVNQSGNSTFTPGLVWAKSRSAATDHALYDVLRGAQARLESNTIDAEATSDAGLTSFDSDGFTVNTLAQVNTNSATYVGWQWKAGGAGVSNTDGTITSSVSANTTAGFSVVTWTGDGVDGATIGHGLVGTTPSMVIIKRRSSTGQWTVHHAGLTGGISGTYGLELNTTDAQTVTFGAGYADTFGSSTFRLKQGGSSINNVNASASTYVAICAAEVRNYSKFGFYNGVSSADGAFIYCGFKPAFVMVKVATGGTGNWLIWDNQRGPYNVIGAVLQPNTTNSEATITAYPIDFLSNGFKHRQNHSHQNSGGYTYIYAAFAEVPSYGATPAKAR